MNMHKNIAPFANFGRSAVMAAAILAACLSAASAVQPGDLDPSFTHIPTVNGTVYSLALLTNGQMVIAGDFTAINGQQCQSVAWLNGDGSTDGKTTNSTYFYGVDYPIYATAALPDGKVLVGVSEQNRVPGAVIDRLNVDGTVDTNFHSPTIGTPTGSEVYALTVQSDGKILVGGLIDSFPDVFGPGQFSPPLVRINSDGTADTNFVAALPVLDFNLLPVPATNPVFSVVVQANGKILVGGLFQTSGRKNIVRLNSDGSLDTTFQNGMAGADNLVSSIALQSDGKILIGGLFSTINGISRHRIARLNTDGSLDTSFQNSMSGVTGDYGGDPFGYGSNVTTPQRQTRGVSAIAMQPDGKVLIVGNFTNVNGALRKGVARLNNDGSLDSGFQNGMSGFEGSLLGPCSVRFQPDGKIVVAGSFTAINGIPRNNIARLNSDGTLDLSFHNGRAAADGPTGWTQSMVFQPDGKVLVAFNNFFSDALIGNAISRLDADGSVDTGFPGATTEFAASGKNTAISLSVDRSPGFVNSIALQPDGKILVGGFFSDINHVARSSIARLNTNGLLDGTFQNGMVGCLASNITPVTCGNVYAVCLQPDGKVLIGGSFNFVNNQPIIDIARLNADGSLDLSFSNNVFGTNVLDFQSYVVRTIALQSDGKILIGGEFTFMNGMLHTDHLVRLNADGSLDNSFQHPDALLGNPVYQIIVQPDGKILFDNGRLNPDGSADGSYQSAGAPLVLQPDGKTINSTSRHYPDGMGDDGFIPPLLTDPEGLFFKPWGTTPIPTLQADGKVLVSGPFTKVNGKYIPHLIRLYGGLAPLRMSGLQVTPSYSELTVVGERGDTVVIEASTNLVQWVPLGTNQFGAPNPPWVFWWSANAFPFRDTNSAAFSKRFYRARLQ